MPTNHDQPIKASPSIPCVDTWPDGLPPERKAAYQRLIKAGQITRPKVEEDRESGAVRLTYLSTTPHDWLLQELTGKTPTDIIHPVAVDRTEKAIFADVYRYLVRFDAPPSMGTEECTMWWGIAAREIALLCAKWENHPLCLELCLTVYNYLEEKCKKKSASP